MDVQTDNQLVTLTKQRFFLGVLLLASVAGNVVLIGKNFIKPKVEVAQVQHDDIELRGTVKGNEGGGVYEFEGTVTNTSKTDAQTVTLKGHYSMFRAKSDSPGFSSKTVAHDYFQVLDTFHNLRAGETRSFHAFMHQGIEKALISGDTSQMDDYGNGVYVSSVGKPVVEWEVSSHP